MDLVYNPALLTITGGSVATRCHGHRETRTLATYGDGSGDRLREHDAVDCRSRIGSILRSVDGIGTQHGDLRFQGNPRSARSAINNNSRDQGHSDAAIHAVGYAGDAEMGFSYSGRMPWIWRVWQSDWILDFRPGRCLIRWFLPTWKAMVWSTRQMPWISLGMSSAYLYRRCRRCRVRLLRRRAVRTRC